MNQKLIATSNMIPNTAIAQFISASAGFGLVGKKKKTVVIEQYTRLTTLVGYPHLPSRNGPGVNLSRPTKSKTAIGRAYEMVRAIVLTLKTAWRTLLAKR